jgi:hypothetical protein
MLWGVSTQECAENLHREETAMTATGTARQSVSIDESVRGKRVRVTREVTALRPTQEWTGCHIWEGTITDAGTRDAVTGDLRGVCVLTAQEHTWIALGEWQDSRRRWVTGIEFL